MRRVSFLLSIGVILALAWLILREGDGPARVRDDGVAGPETNRSSLRESPGSAEAVPLESSPFTSEEGGHRDPSGIRGCALSPEGQPVVAARILALPWGSELRRAIDLREVPESVASTVTDGNGRFALNGEGLAPRNLLIALRDDLPPASSDAVTPGSDGVVLRFDQGVAIVGAVRDEDGRSIKGARVALRALLGDLAFERAATSDGLGRYRIAGIPDPNLAPLRRPGLLVQAAGFTPAFFEHVNAPWVAGPPGPTITVTYDFVLARTTGAWGTVVDAETEVPIAGAVVEAWSTRGHQHLTSWEGASRYRSPWGLGCLESVRTEADGGFRFAHFPLLLRGAESEYVRIRVRAHGYADGGVEVIAAEELQGARLLEPVRVVRSGGVTGRVLDHEGRPASAARVSFAIAGWAAVSLETRGPLELPPASHGYWRPDASWNPRCEIVTDDEGVFRYEGLPCPGGAVEVCVRASWLLEEPAETTVSVRAGEFAQVPELRLPEPRRVIRLAGLVTGRDGAPILGARVECANVDRVCVTDADGRFEVHLDGIEGVLREPVDLHVAARGFMAAQLAIPSVDPDRPVAIVLDRGHALGGRVRYADGAPVPFAWVHAFDGSRPFGEVRNQLVRGIWPSARADREGRFAFDDLPSGPWHFEFRAAPPQQQVGRRLDVPPEAAELEFVFECGAPGFGSLLVRALDAGTGAPIAGWPWARLVQPRENYPGRRAGPALVRIGPAPAGSYRLLVAADGYAERVLDFELGPDAEQTLEVALDPATKVDVTVRRADGQPLETTGLQVSGRDEGGNVVRGNIQGGTATFERLTRGRWRFTAERPGDDRRRPLRERNPLTVELDPGRPPRDLELLLVPAVTLLIELPVIDATDPMPTAWLEDEARPLGKKKLSELENWQEWHQYLWWEDRAEQRARSLRLEVRDDSGNELHAGPPRTLVFERDVAFARVVVPPGESSIILERGETPLLRRTLTIAAGETARIR